jgi:hypothetical protein
MVFIMFITERRAQVKERHDPLPARGHSSAADW